MKRKIYLESLKKKFDEEKNLFSEIKKKKFDGEKFDGEKNLFREFR